MASSMNLSLLRRSLIVGMAIVGSAVPSAFTSGTVTRIAGTDRYQTAARLSAESKQPGVSVVYVASGVGFADADGEGGVHRFVFEVMGCGK